MKRFLGISIFVLGLVSGCGGSGDDAATPSNALADPIRIETGLVSGTVVGGTSVTRASACRAGGSGGTAAVGAVGRRAPTRRSMAAGLRQHGLPLDAAATVGRCSRLAGAAPDSPAE